MNELVRRIAITIGVPLIFRVGSHIPIPLTGISAQSRLLSSGAIDQVLIFSLTLARIVTLLLASFQASGVASAMQNISGLIARGLEALGRRAGGGHRRLSRPRRVVDDGGGSRLPLSSYR